MFAGLELKGVVIKTDKDDMSDVYGANVKAKQVLEGGQSMAAVSVRAFPLMLARYSTRAGTR